MDKHCKLVPVDDNLQFVIRDLTDFVNQKTESGGEVLPDLENEDVLF